MEILYQIDTIRELTVIPIDDDISIRWLSMPDDASLLVQRGYMGNRRCKSISVTAR